MGWGKKENKDRYLFPEDSHLSLFTVFQRILGPRSVVRGDLVQPPIQLGAPTVTGAPAVIVIIMYLHALGPRED